MNRYRHDGYTIPELVVVLSVVSILSLVLVNFFGTALMQNAIATTRAELLGQAHLALDRINDDIRLSARVDENNRWEDVYAPDAPGDLFSWQSSDSVVVLASAAEDGDRQILFEDASQYISWKDNIIYFLENGTLYRRVLAAPVDGNAARTTCPVDTPDEDCLRDDRVLFDNVDNFEIRYLDTNNQVVGPSEARSVELEIELKKRAFGRDITASHKTRMVFRNG